MRSPTTRTLAFFRKQDCEAVVLEKWVTIPKHPGGGIRKDCWGADILVRQGSLLMAVQSTSGSNHSSRVTKSLDNPAVLNWLHCGVAFYIYSWAKKGARGHRRRFFRHGGARQGQALDSEDNSVSRRWRQG